MTEKSRDLIEDESEQIQNALDFMAQLRRELKSSNAETRPTNTSSETPVDTPQGVEDLPGQKTGSIKSVGRFEILDLLGFGGFSKVYLARDPSLNRHVALKMLKPSLHFSAEALSRFDREGRAVALLNHPNIVPVFETGSIGSDRFIASAYCDGPTLKQWFADQDKEIDPRIAAKIIETTAQAIEHAHQRGIYHRDLKPANILIERVAETEEQTDYPLRNDRQDRVYSVVGVGQVRVTDFGLAKFATETDQFETTEGAIVGTPAYMSPEQATAENELSGATDIYSLGVILFELLTGSLPHQGESHIDTLLSIKNEEPPSLRSIRTSVPRDLEAICLKCLNKSPQSRYASPHELAEDLIRWRESKPIAARRVTTIERAQKWCVRNPFLTIMFVALSAALLTALAAWRSSVQQHELATQHLNRADRHLALSQEVIDEMVSQVALDPKLPAVLRREVAQRAVSFQDQLLAEEPENPDIAIQTALAHRRLAEVLFHINDFENAIIAADYAIALAEQFEQEPRMKPIRIESADVKAAVYRSTKQHDKAEAEIKNAHGDDDDESVSHDKVFQMAMIKLGKGNFAESIIDFEQALLLLPANPHGHDSDAQRARIELYCGQAELNLEHLDIAYEKTSYAQSVFERLRNADPDHQSAAEDNGRALLQLGRVARAWTQDRDSLSADELKSAVDEARDCFERANTNFQLALAQNPLLTRARGQIAMVHEFQVRLEVEQRDPAMAEKTIQAFNKTVEDLPRDYRERGLIGRIFAESQIKIAKMLIEIGAEDSAQRQLQSCLELLSKFIEEYPEMERLKELKQECEQLLSVH